MAVYIGIDWSAAKHDLCVLNENGSVIATTVLPHTADGLLKLEALRQKLGVDPAACLIGIETAHTLVIDFLWARDYSHVYVIPPGAGQKHARSLSSERSAYRHQRCVARG